MSLADGIAWEKEYGWNVDVPKKPYNTIEEFIEWINTSDLDDVEKLLTRYGFKFTESDEKWISWPLKQNMRSD